MQRGLSLKKENYEDSPKKLTPIRRCSEAQAKLNRFEPMEVSSVLHKSIMTPRLSVCLPRGSFQAQSVLGAQTVYSHISESNIGAQIKTSTNPKNPKKRILCLGGAQYQIIKKSQYLREHFSIIMHIYGGILGYGLTDIDKKDIIKNLKIGPNQYTSCMAIGDGFNDIGMMSVSDLSIQIQREGLSGVHADLIAPNFFAINNLMFNHAIYLRKNFEHFMYHLLFRTLIGTYFIFIFQFQCKFTGTSNIMIFTHPIIEYVLLLVIGCIYIFGEQILKHKELNNPVSFYYYWRKIDSPFKSARLFFYFIVLEPIGVNLIFTAIWLLIGTNLQGRDGNLVTIFVIRYVFYFIYMIISMVHLLMMSLTTIWKQLFIGTFLGLSLLFLTVVINEYAGMNHRI